MSSQLHSYLGPYIKVTERPQTVTRYVFGCPNSTCERFVKSTTGVSRSDDFCAKCGTKHENVPRTIEVATDLAEVVDEELTTMGDTQSNGDIFLIPNVTRPGDPDRTLDEDTLHLDLHAVSTSDEIDWLRKAFAPELEKLKLAYDNVEVSWGFHQYWR
jgi:hypothetical protein